MMKLVNISFFLKKDIASSDLVFILESFTILTT